MADKPLYMLALDRGAVCRIEVLKPVKNGVIKPDLILNSNVRSFTLVHDDKAPNSFRLL